MRTHWSLIAGTLACLALPLAAHAQGVIGGAQEGAVRGNRAAGPVGGAVGSVVGGAVGGVVGGVRGVVGEPAYGYRDRRVYRHRGYRHMRRHRY